MFQRIFVPLDGSSRAEQAVPVAARIARSTGGSVLLMEVVNIPIDYSGGMAPVALMTGQEIESEMADALDYLKTIAASPELSGIATRTEVSFGVPAQCIIESASQSDLIVLCSHGRTGFARWALGSVAHRLVHQSSVPLLVLRQSDSFPRSCHPEQSEGSPRPLRALVPLDGSRLAETALRPAAHLIAALSAPAQGALHLVQVVKASPAAGEEEMASEQPEVELHRARSYLKAVAEHVQATQKKLKLSITCAAVPGGDVADVLLCLAESEGQGNLIAISTHGRGGLQRWVLGSVTERLLNTTKLPMLIVRPENKG